MKYKQQRKYYIIKLRNKSDFVFELFICSHRQENLSLAVNRPQRKNYKNSKAINLI